MKGSRIAFGSIIGGALVTLVTGLLSNQPSLLLGSSWYGYPLKWLIRRIVAPQYNPWKVLPANLVFDLIFWIVVVAVILLPTKSSGSEKRGRKR